MTQVKDLLERRSQGWEADEEEAGQGLYFTEKQTRVFKAIVENQEANIKEIADRAGVHPSYVRYIVNRLPTDRATDTEWLMEKAGVDPEDLEEEEEAEEESEVEVEEEPVEEEIEEPETSEEPPEPATQEAEAASLMQSFGLNGSQEVESIPESEGTQVSMTHYLPVTITVTFPEEMFMEEEGGDRKMMLTPEEVADQGQQAEASD